jgi:hypothetical protein
MVLWVLFTILRVLFEVPFKFEHFPCKDLALLQDRELDYAFRTKQLI